jgi:DNA uptake protein ComE-like DNA-binding protein
VRLAPIGAKQAVSVSEGGKLDVNVVTGAMLGHLEGVGEATGGKIVGARGAGFGSPEELGTVDGVSAGLLFGAGDAEDAQGGESSTSKSLLAQTTVFSFDPNTTMGVGAQASGDELERVSVSQGWTEDLRPDLTERMSAQAVAALETALKGGAKPAHDSELVAALVAAQQPPEVWADVLAGVTTSDEQFQRGRVDLNSATAAVLACVPGIDQAAADKIVEARERLPATSRRSVAWPLKEGILKPEQFQTAVDWMTTRSLQWRVRVEARLDRGDAQGASTTVSRAGSRAATEEAEEAPPGMVWEAVIDVSGMRARVAYLRDVTYLAALAQRAREQEKSASTGATVASAADTPPATETPDTQPEGSLGSLKTDKFQPQTDLKTQKMKVDNDLHFVGSESSGSLHMDTDVKLHGDPAAPTGVVAGEAAGSPAGQAKPGDAPADQKPVTLKDRRIGRWRGTSKE